MNVRKVGAGESAGRVMRSRIVHTSILVVSVFVWPSICPGGSLDLLQSQSLECIQRTCIQVENLQECRKVTDAFCKNGNTWACKPCLGLVDLLISASQSCSNGDQQGCNRRTAVRSILGEEIRCQQGDLSACANLEQFQRSLSQTRQVPQFSDDWRTIYHQWEAEQEAIDSEYNKMMTEMEADWRVECAIGDENACSQLKLLQRQRKTEEAIQERHDEREQERLERESQKRQRAIDRMFKN